MRDIAVTLIVFGALPFILRWPEIGVYVWSWISYMNPHRLSYGFAREFPYAYVTALALLVAVFVSKGKRRLPISAPVIIWIVLILYMALTTAFATNPEGAGDQLEKVLKIQFGTLMTLLFINTQRKLYWLVVTIVVSLGFFGVKGGLFAYQSGEGGGLVWGPPGTFIGGNNEVGLAILMTVPLMRFLQMQETRPLIKHGLTVAMGLSLFAVAGTYSRGAFLAGACMLLFLWWKGDKKLISVVIGAPFVAILLAFMPASWWERMGTIKTYEEDGSAMGRIDAWTTAIGLANNRLFGGGFEAWTSENFARYGGGADLARDVHSIYFEMLGEHGYGGLILFLLLWLMSWRLGSKVIRASRAREALRWHGDLARMAQVSLIAYLAGGAFLGLAYFDLPYHLFTIFVILHMLVTSEAAASAPVAAPLPGTKREGRWSRAG